MKGSTIYTDGWKAYNGLILNGYDHYRIFHHENEFARGKNHVNEIESFWSFAKNRLSKFNGFTNDRFILHLKECEYRSNNRNATRKEFEKMLLKITKYYFRNKEKSKSLVKVNISSRLTSCQAPCFLYFLSLVSLYFICHLFTVLLSKLKRIAMYLSIFY